MVNKVDATEPPAVVDHISDLTAVPLFAKARKAQADPPSVIEVMDDEVLPSAHTATMVFPVPLEYATDMDAGAVLPPVLFAAPPTREIVDESTGSGVEKVKLADVAVPAELVDTTA
jgi:hypothetical protein